MMRISIFIDCLIITFVVIKLIVVIYGVSVASESKESKAPKSTVEAFYISTIA